MQSGQITFQPDPKTNPTAIGNNWNHLEQQKLEEEAKKNAAVQTEEQTITNEEKLEKLVESAGQFCYKIKTHFPLDPFPNELLIDIHKVSVIYKTLLSKNAVSIPLKDINKAEVFNDFMFASMEIVNGSQTTTLEIKWLYKKEAREAQAIIQGLLVAYKNDIDISQFDPSDISEKLKTLGSPVS